MKLSNNKFYLFLFITLLISGLFFFSVGNIKAFGDAYFPQDTTVDLDVDTFTIVGGSDADTVVTSNTQITVTISDGQSFTLESSARKLLTTDTYSFSCLNDKSSLIITSTVTRTVVITPSATDCGEAGRSSGGGGGGGVTVLSTPTPTPVSTSLPQVTPTPTTTPVSTPTPSPAIVGLTPVSRGFINLATLKLKEGDVISAAGSDDPDVYIVNEHGYKRLFLNPVIFGFYGHLGGFNKVKSTVVTTRDTLVTSGLFRNCETNDEKVYGVETTGEDTGMLHWVNITGAQAIADDPDFFKKVFCINSNELNWYKKSTPYTSVNQIPSYTRIFNKEI